MYILGINAYHGDSSAALLKDGKLVAALEEERIRRIKHWAGFPSEAIKFCLDYAGIGIKDVDYIAISRNPFARFHKKIIRIILRLPKFSFLKSRLNNIKKLKSIKENLAEIFNVNRREIKAEVVNVEHHRAHLSSSFFFSPFKEAAVVSIDGFGDFVSTMAGVGKDNRIKINDLVEFPYSLGIFYTALTQFLGFWKYGDEYKVMGLSAFGNPVYLDKMKKIVKLKNNGFFELDTSYFLHDKEGVEMTWLDGEPKIGKLFSDKLVELFGEPRKENEEVGEKFKDIAASVQAMYEEAFFHILNNLYKKTKMKNIALAGGCIQNSLANGKIYEKTPFKNVFIPPAAHDAGGAMGSAMYVWNQILEKERNFVMMSPFWGPEYDEKYLEKYLNKAELKYERLENNDLIKKVAKFLADSKIIGWFQGRTEWGPRALGNRSILANPCNPKMKDILNLKIKKRESFRPFAPSILEEEVLNYFEENKPVSFMEKVYEIKEEKRKLIPAVTHIDGTGRLQTVSRKDNPLYYDLIKEFGRLTGVPILINTSFNENEPIVNKPEEAIDCFLRTDMDVLVLGNYIVIR
ncbi:MAG: carbamoyltransferase C-terminal domain-containing protein [Patescibacteria group bacterium]